MKVLDPVEPTSSPTSRFAIGAGIVHEGEGLRSASGPYPRCTSTSASWGMRPREGRHQGGGDDAGLGGAGGEVEDDVVHGGAFEVHRDLCCEAGGGILREIGCLQCDVVAKSDQEPAITSIVSEVGRIRAATGGGRNIVESSLVGSSGSNGVVERAIRSVEQQVRVMKDAHEHRRACSSRRGTR